MQIVAEQSDQQDQQDEKRVASKKRKTDRASEHVKENTKKRSKPELITAAAPARTSKVIDQAKRICKQASIKIPPSTYAKTKSLTEVEAEFESLLNKHGLSLDATSHFIEKVRRK